MFFLLLLSLYFVLNKVLLGENQLTSNIINPSKEIVQQGKIIIKNIDGESELPIKDTEFIISEVESGEIVEVLFTNEEGISTTNLLDYGKAYEVKQVEVMQPYDLVNDTTIIEINEDQHQLIFKNYINKFVKNYSRDEDGNFIIHEVYIDVPTVMQEPELPNGCEITSLTSVLNFYGYSITKTEMSDNYLPKGGFYWRDGKLFGADPYVAFSGEPRDSNGWFVYAPPIVQSADNYITEGGGNHKAIDISGSTREELIEYINKGVPVVIWSTRDLKEARFNYSWYIEDSATGETILFDAAVNLHAYVLNGYTEDKVHVMDPLKGQVIYDAEAFFKGYESLGSHAVVII